MKAHHSFAVLGGLLLGLSCAGAMAADNNSTSHPARPTEAQMKAVQACAAAKGVEMPAPPTKGEKPSAPPKLTDAQKAVMDACFKEAGLEPPKGPPHGDKGGEPKGPPPSETESE